MNTPHTTQRGFALLVALIFLIILTLLSVTAMRSSTMELRMASNEQSQRIGFDSAESAVDTLLATNQLMVTTPGDINCFGFGTTPACDSAVNNMDLGANAGAGTENFVKTTLNTISTCPRSLKSSARGSSSLRATTTGTSASGTCAYFSVESTYDATAERGGRVETQQGYVKYAP